MCAGNHLPRPTVFFFPRTGQYLIVVLFLLKWQLSSQLNVCNITVQTDSYTEQLIQKALAKLMHGRTSFVIAHRLSTIRDADMILYMEHGDILEHGSHEELMAQHGKYEALYMSQFAQ